MEHVPPLVDQPSVSGHRESTDRTYPQLADLPVDPDVLRTEQLPPPTPLPGPGQRRRAEPRPLWRRLAPAVSNRRDVLSVIAAGGAVGSLARWGAGLAWPHQPGRFAWATFAVNVTGCFLIGVLMVLVTDVWPPSRYARPFLGVGVLGGFTTFSTYMLDTRAMLVAGRPDLAGAYLFGSLGAGMAAVWLAVFATRWLVTLPRALRRRRRDRDVRAEEASAVRHGDQGGLDGGFNEVSRRMP